MNAFQKMFTLTAATLGLGLQATLVTYTFTDAPVISTAQTNLNRSSAPTTLGSGVSASNFTIENGNYPQGTGTNETNNNRARVIAAAAPTGDPPTSAFYAAQIAGLNTTGYQWEGGSFANVPYFQFTINQVEALTQLTLSIRDGIEWAGSNGALSSYANNRQSFVTIRSSLDNFAANIGDEFSPNGTTATSDFETKNISLTSLNTLLISPTDVTFRIYTKATGTDFHRTQIQSVQVTGVAIPEPGTLALVGITGLAMVLGYRRRKK